MSGINKVILIGHLGADPEMNYTQSGVPVTKFRIATTEKWGKDEQGNTKEHTEWHSIVAWRKLGEICSQYLTKGSKVYIEGRLRTSNWEGQDGIKRYKTEIHIDELLMLSAKGERIQIDDESIETPEYKSNKGSFPGNRPDSDDTKKIDPDSDDLDDNFI